MVSSEVATACALERDLRVRTVSDYPSFLRLGAQWDDLVERAGIENPFLTHTWLRAWWEAYGADRRLRILIAEEDGLPMAIAPLMLGRARFCGVPVRQLESMANAHTPRFDFIVAGPPEPACVALWREILDGCGRDWDTLRLCQLPSNALALASLPEEAERRSLLVGLWPSSDSPYLPLDCSFEDYHRGLDRKHRENLRKRLRRLGALGPVRHEVVTSAGDFSAALLEGLRIEAQAWKGRAGTAILNDPAAHSFYSRLGEEAARRGWARLNFLRVGDTRIAFDFSLHYRSRCFALKSGYAPAYARDSPYQVLCSMVLRRAFEEGLAEVDFLGGREYWKLNWTRRFRPHCWAYVVPPRWPLRVAYQAKFELAPTLRRQPAYRFLRSRIFGAEAPRACGDPVPARVPPAEPVRRPAGTSGPPAIAVETLSDTGRLESARAEWEELLQASDSDGLFLSWDWLSTWWRHLGAGRLLSVLVLRAAGQVVGLAPFLASRRRVSGLRVPTLEFLGSGAVGSDYLDVVARRGWEDEVARTLGGYLARRRLALRLEGVSAAGALASRLAGALEGRGFSSGTVAMEPSPYIDLRGRTFDAYLAGLGSEHRYAFRRKLRALSRRYATSFDMVRTEPERSEALATLVRLHTLRWRDRGGSSALHQPELVAFHEDVTRRALAGGYLRLFVLRLDGKPAAALYGFRCGRVFYFYQSGLDPAHARDSVGLVTMGLAIQRAIEEGAEEYDMLHGAEAYKFHWASATRELVRLELFPSGVRGAVWRRGRELDRAARRLARATLPEGVASWVRRSLQTGVFGGGRLGEQR
jgi:CelD/BcsL family acetyltransferase involved in cellulose biosynthesis